MTKLNIKVSQYVDSVDHQVYWDARVQDGNIGSYLRYGVTKEAAITRCKEAYQIAKNKEALQASLPEPEIIEVDW